MSVFNGLEDEDGPAKGTRTEKPGAGRKLRACSILKSQWEIGRGSFGCCLSNETTTKNVHWIKQLGGAYFGGMARQQCGTSTHVFKKLNSKRKGKAEG